MAPRLKVYRTKAGFYETVVAAPNQAAALGAWGIRQNLFAEGEADLVSDAAVAKVALAHPGQPLRRAIGSSVAFELDPSSLPDIPKVAKRKDAPAQARTSAAAPKPRPKPDRQPLERAEAEIARLDADFETQKAEIEQRRQALDDARAEAEDRWRTARKTAVQVLTKARRDFRRAGSEP